MANRVRRVKRQNKTEQETKQKTEAMIVAEIITESLEPKYCTLTGRNPKDCTNHFVFKKYSHVFEKIASYLLELRGNYKNSFESLVHDYLVSVYRRYAYHRKTPFLTQLIPSDNNQIKFEEWIHMREEDFSEPYWTNIDVRSKSMEIAKKHIAMSKERIAESQDNYEINEI